MRTFEQARSDFLNFIELMYADTSDPEYDMLPTAHVVEGDQVFIYGIAGDGNPMDMAKMIAGKHANADMFFFASACWTKDPVTYERNGEMVMAIAETPGSQEIISYKLTRDPLPLLTRDKDIKTAGVRVGGFIFKPTEQ